MRPLVCQCNRRCSSKFDGLRGATPLTTPLERDATGSRSVQASKRVQAYRAKQQSRATEGGRQSVSAKSISYSRRPDLPVEWRGVDSSVATTEITSLHPHRIVRSGGGGGWCAYMAESVV